jgi:hypothetical protein
MLVGLGQRLRLELDVLALTVQGVLKIRTVHSDSKSVDVYLLLIHTNVCASILLSSVIIC